MSAFIFSNISFRCFQICVQLFTANLSKALVNLLTLIKMFFCFLRDYPCEESFANQSWIQENKYVTSTLECSCETGYQECPEGAAGPEPPKRLLPTTEYIYNMTGWNITDWILKSHEHYVRQRYYFDFPA